MMNNKFIGKKKLQPFFEKLFYLSLKGMNYGTGSNYIESGEKNIINLLNRNFKNVLIFDVGANKGQYSNLLRNNLKIQYKIYAFEPTRFCIDSLKNDENKNFIICDFALSNKEGTSVIHFDKDGSTWASIGNSDYGRHNKKLEKTEIIKLKTLDSFCTEKNISKINFLKIDVEGHEIEVLQGAKNMLKNNNIDIVQFEFGLASLFTRTILLDFFKILENYRIYRILQDGFREVVYHEAYEIFLTTNYVAINKNIQIKL